MIIWRNLDPRALAQLLVWASQALTARLAAGRSCPDRNGGSNHRPTLSPRRGGRSRKSGSNGDV